MDRRSAAEPAPQFGDYRKEWLASVQDGAPNTVQLGHRFPRKLVTQWLDVDEAAPSGASGGDVRNAFIASRR